MILIDPKLLEQLEGSTCFGIAHDATARECKSCDLQQECSAKTAGNSLFDQIKILKPETQEALDKATDKRKAKDDVENEDGLTPRQLRKKRKREERAKLGMPETKGMPVEDLWKLLNERGGSCATYDDPSVQKMRLVMEIKKTFVAEFNSQQE